MLTVFFLLVILIHEGISVETMKLTVFFFFEIVGIVVFDYFLEDFERRFWISRTASIQNVVDILSQNFSTYL